MVYDDFKILTNEEYEKLNSEYLLNPSNRKLYISNIISLLSKITHCNQENLINQQLKPHIKTLKTICNNIITTLKSNTQTNEVVNFNIFNVLEILNETIYQFYIWQEIETKEYYLDIIKSSIKNLLECSKNIISILKILNIKIHKYM